MARVSRYKELRAAGFSPEQARRFRFASAENVAKAIASKVLPELNKQAQKAGAAKGEKFWERVEQGLEVVSPKRASGGSLKYETALSYGQNYYSAFAYVVTYKKKDGTDDFITIVSRTPKSRSEVNAIAKDRLQQGFNRNRERYGVKSDVLMNTLKVRHAVYNPNRGGYDPSKK